MQNPASPPRSIHSCPNCHRPVEPGYKFCESCGTPIPELKTCSKCGTQFITQEKYCDLCGATFIPGEVPEPSDAPEGELENPEEDSEEYPVEEETGPVGEPAPERDAEENPEVDTDGFPEEFNEEDGLPDSDDAPPPPDRDTREPRTDELLEHYGEEYGVDETLGSPRTPNSRTPNLRPKAETFDDALFTLQRKPRAPAKSRGNTTRIIGGVLVLIAMVAVVYFIGLPMLAGNGGAVTITPRRNPPLPGHPRQPRPRHLFQGHLYPRQRN